MSPITLLAHKAAQALLVEVTKTAAKHKTISAWTSAVAGPDRGTNGNHRGGDLKFVRGPSVRSLESLHARQDRATLLMTEKVWRVSIFTLRCLRPWCDLLGL